MRDNSLYCDDLETLFFFFYDVGYLNIEIPRNPRKLGIPEDGSAQGWSWGEKCRAKQKWEEPGFSYTQGGDRRPGWRPSELGGGRDLEGGRDMQCKPMALCWVADVPKGSRRLVEQYRSSQKFRPTTGLQNVFLFFFLFLLFNRVSRTNRVNSNYRCRTTST